MSSKEEAEDDDDNEEGEVHAQRPPGPVTSTVTPRLEVESCTSVSPLTYAFPWITSAFVGHLSVDQLLLVWDRIIGNDSLLVLPVLAAAIFAFRKKALMAATCAEDIEEALEDLQELKAIPILQAFISA